MCTLGLGLDCISLMAFSVMGTLENIQNGQEIAWVGAECQIMLGKIVGSEKKVVVPKLEKAEVFGQ